MESKKHLEFQRLWELVMIRSSLKAMYETVGSIMGQDCAKGHYLDPENFSKELVLNFNLGPLKDLDGLIDERTSSTILLSLFWRSMLQLEEQLQEIEIRVQL